MRRGESQKQVLRGMLLTCGLASFEKSMDLYSKVWCIYICIVSRFVFLSSHTRAHPTTPTPTHKQTITSRQFVNYCVTVMCQIYRQARLVQGPARRQGGAKLELSTSSQLARTKITLLLLANVLSMDWNLFCFQRLRGYLQTSWQESEYIFGWVLSSLLTGEICLFSFCDCGCKFCSNSRYTVVTWNSEQLRSRKKVCQKLQRLCI